MSYEQPEFCVCGATENIIMDEDGTTCDGACEDNPAGAYYETAENQEYRFPDGKSWEEHYDTYEKFIQSQVKHFQLFADLVPLGLVKDPVLKPVIEKVIADAKDALTKCPNKKAVMMKNYWE